MHHKMLTQRTLFADSNTKKGTLSEQFVTHVTPPLIWDIRCVLTREGTCPYIRGGLYEDSTFYIMHSLNKGHPSIKTEASHPQNYPFTVLTY